MTRDELLELAEEWVKRTTGPTWEGWETVLVSIKQEAKWYPERDTGPELVEMLRWLGNESTNPKTHAKYRRVWLVVSRYLELRANAIEVNQGWNTEDMRFYREVGTRRYAATNDPEMMPQYEGRDGWRRITYEQWAVLRERVHKYLTNGRAA